MSHFSPSPKSNRFVGALLSLSLFSFGLLGQAHRAIASNFGVSPIQIFLSPKNAREASSSLLEVRNDSKTVLRFQVNAFAWSQTAQEQMQLAPTEDIVFFPKMLSLAPGEKRNIRLGTLVAAGAQEKNYRVVVEELPPLKTADAANSGAQIKVLTKMSVPLFIQPGQPSLSGTIQDMSVNQGKLGFRVKNTGNVHFSASKIRVQAYGTADKPLFDRSTTGWYLLANSDRSFELEMPKGDCAQIRTLTIEVQTSNNKVQTATPPKLIQSLQTPGGVCSTAIR